MTNKHEKALLVKQKYEKRWLKINGVTAVGIGSDQNNAVIIITVVDNQEKVSKQVPENIDGISVKIKASGKFKAF